MFGLDFEERAEKNINTIECLLETITGFVPLNPKDTSERLFPYSYSYRWEAEVQETKSHTQGHIK